MTNPNEDKYLDWLLDPDRAFKDDLPPVDVGPAPGSSKIELDDYMDSRGYKYWCWFCNEGFHEKQVKQWFSKTNPVPCCPKCCCPGGSIGWGENKI